MRARLTATAAISAVGVVGLAGIATGQTVVKTAAVSASITAVAPIAPCGQTLKVPVTIKAGTMPAQGTIVIGGVTRATAPYNVAPGATATISVSTTLQVSCGASGATIPNAAVWLEPTSGGNDGMMWTLRPSAVTYVTTKSSIPG